MLLSLSNVNASYGYVRALRDVSLDVPEGDIVTLLGSNGSGKSTILKVISGTLLPLSGQVLFQGSNIIGLSAEELVIRGIVQVPEGRQIFPELTVQENLMVGAYTRKDKQEVALDIKRMEEHFPVLGQRRKQLGGTLSGGEQQMLAIARALVARPRILLLDEPSLGLAPKLVSEIFAIIKDINTQGTTILLVEQNAARALEIADHAYVLEAGAITISGAAASIRNDPRVKAAYLGGEKRSKTRSLPGLNIE